MIPLALAHDAPFSKVVALCEKDPTAGRAYLMKLRLELDHLSEVTTLKRSTEVTIQSMMDLLWVGTDDMDDIFKDMAWRISLLLEYKNVILHGSDPIEDRMGREISTDDFIFYPRGS